MKIVKTILIHFILGQLENFKISYNIFLSPNIF